MALQGDGYALGLDRGAEFEAKVVESPQQGFGQAEVAKADCRERAHRRVSGRFAVGRFSGRSRDVLGGLGSQHHLVRATLWCWLIRQCLGRSRHSGDGHDGLIPGGSLRV